jgi:ribosomal protein S27E
MAQTRERNIVTPRVVLDLRETLRVRCFDCQHEAVVDIINLIDRGLGDREIMKFRYRCTLCGSANANPRLSKMT